jgi:hypothetical protein
VRSSTTTGAATAQIVRRNSPGMMSRTSPIATPSPNRIETSSSVTTTGEMLANSSPTELSSRPSWTSRTNSTTMPW